VTTSHRSLLVWILAASSLSLVACARPQPIAVRAETSKVSLRAAIVPLQTTLSCRGGAFCREDVLRPEASEGELAEDCTRRGGTLEHAACARTDAVASCAGSSDSGSVVVFTYAQANKDDQESAVSRMSDLCDAMGGELALPR